MSSTDFKRGYRACIDDVLNSLQTVDDEHFKDANSLRHEIFKKVSLLKPENTAAIAQLVEQEASTLRASVRTRLAAPNK